MSADVTPRVERVEEAQHARSYYAVIREPGAAWDPSVPMTEQEGWSEHAAFMNGLAAKGFVYLGGPLTERQQTLLVVDASGPDEIRSTLAEDPWSANDLLRIASIEPWTILLEAPGS
jgi:hypothetical protein